MGGIPAIFIVDGINNAVQIKGIVVSVIIASVAGYLSGKILSAFGRRVEAYTDSEEIIEAVE